MRKKGSGVFTKGCVVVHRWPIAKEVWEGLVAAYGAQREKPRRGPRSVRLGTDEAGLWGCLVDTPYECREEVDPARPTQPGRIEWVYFARCPATGHIKIGWTTQSPEARVRSISAPVPLVFLAATPGGRHNERELHRRFASDRVHREWFRTSPDLEGIIAVAKEKRRSREMTMRRDARSAAIVVIPKAEAGS